MSTRSSRYYRDCGSTGNLHLYHEMHDGMLHLEIEDGHSHSFVNIILTGGLAMVLEACLRPEAA